MTVAIYGKAGRCDDPARFPFAYGGKDRLHFPVPIKTYDQSISILQKAVGKARMGQQEKLESLKKLHKITMAIEKNCDPFADVSRIISHEKRNSWKYGGRTVTGFAKHLRDKSLDGEQLALQLFEKQDRT